MTDIMQGVTGTETGPVTGAEAVSETGVGSEIGAGSVTGLETGCDRLDERNWLRGRN